MKIKYLGTAAADALPAVFCECETCLKSRRLGGKNIRTRSQSLIDDKLLIDFPGDTYMHSIMYNIELSKIKTCIITHSHFDHLYPAELWTRMPGIGHFDREPLTIYSAEDGYRRTMEVISEYKLDESNRVYAKEITPFTPFEAEGYKITPLKAHHDPASSPVIYIISKDGKNMLYANDTGFFPEETKEYLKSSGIKLDLVSFDCTGALNNVEDYGNGSHMNLIADIKTKKMLREYGNITDDTICIVNHFSHNGLATYDDMLEPAEKEGFIVAYDGLEVEF